MEEMGINLKKIFIFFAIVVGSLVYVKTHYTFDDALKYSKENPEAFISPKTEYFIGWLSYVRSDYDQAIVAFDQLLTFHPTCQYAQRANFRLASSYKKNENWAKARKAYLRYMEEYPDAGKFELAKKNYEYIKFK